MGLSYECFIPLVVVLLPSAVSNVLAFDCLFIVALVCRDSTLIFRDIICAVSIHVVGLDLNVFRCFTKSCCHPRWLEHFLVAGGAST